jgi:molybdate transport system substrate-binding protein
MTRALGGLLMAGAIAASGCGNRVQTAGKLEVRIAAAANLTEVFQKLGPIFEAQTAIHPVFSFGSTAQLARQIENSAPYDVIAAADIQHVDELDRKGLLVPGSRAPYAEGVLALWIPPNSRATVARIEDLTRPDVQVIAIAKPDLAPYGQASVEALRRLGIWDRVKPKIVYAENISMAKQYGSSDNADAVFTAYSLVQREGGRIIVVVDKLHEPILQELGIVAASPNRDTARRFTAFLLAGPGRSILQAYGYRPPPAAPSR